MKYCEAPDCGNPQKYTIYCGKHYIQVYRNGRLLDSTRNDPRPAVVEGDIARIPLGVNARQGYAIVDKGFAYLGGNNWHKTSDGYAARSKTVDGKKQTERMHRVIHIGATQVDHINGNTLDNRSSNLRGVTTSQNGMNRGRMSNNKSGYKGVSWHKKSERFRANICVNQVRMHVGQYKTALEAARAYNSAALDLHGKFARLNNV